MTGHDPAPIRTVDVTAAARPWRFVKYAAYLTITQASSVLALMIWLAIQATARHASFSPWELAVSAALGAILLFNAVVNWLAIGRLDFRLQGWMFAGWILLLVPSGAIAFVSFGALKSGALNDDVAAVAFGSGVAGSVFVAAAVIGIVTFAAARWARISGKNVNVPALLRDFPPAPQQAHRPIQTNGARLALAALFIVSGLACLVGASGVSENYHHALIVLGWFLILIARGYSKPPVNVLLATDKRKPILFLRSFADDEKVSVNRRTLYSFIDVSLEMRLAKHFNAYGPFIAVGSPSDLVPRLGAARASLSDQEWQSAVLNWMDDAQAIVLFVGKTNWVNWELTNIISRGDAEKLVIMFPQTRHWSAQARRQDADERFDYLSDALAGTKWDSSIKQLGDCTTIRAIVLSETGGLTVIRSRNFARDSYHLAAIVAHEILLGETAAATMPRTVRAPAAVQSAGQAIPMRGDPTPQAPGEDMLLSVKELSVAFGQGPRKSLAVDRVSFDIGKGETVALVGESGSGKSVTALSILKLLPYPAARHPSGTIVFKGRDLLPLAEREMRRVRGDDITIVFQEPMTSLNPLHTIEKQIGEILLLHRGLTGAAARARTLEVLTQVGIPDPQSRLASYPHQLSGGQRQRVMIAMALANEPDLLIADEPTTALDVTVQAQIIELLQGLRQRLGMSLLFITHDLGIVRKIAQRVCVMKEGKIVEQGEVERVFTAPQHPYTRALLAAEPKPDPAPPQPNAPMMLEATDLKVWFPIKRGVLRRVVGHIKAVDGVSIDLRKGETLGVVGESGSGKTTLGLALLRLISSQGPIVFMGNALQGLRFKEMRPFRRDMQIVFQDPYGSLSPRLSVADIIQEGLQVHHPAMSERERDERVVRALGDVGLDPATRFRFPHEFSGGQRQRVAVARAIVLEPSFIVLDEPTSALDMLIQSQMVDLLRELQKRRNLTYLFISHDLRVVAALASRLLVMRHGKVVETGAAADLFKNPKSDYTRALFAAAFNLETSPAGVVAQ